MTDIDMGPFVDPAYWSHGSDTRADMFRLLRDEAPVLFMEEPEIEGFAQGPRLLVGHPLRRRDGGVTPPGGVLLRAGHEHRRPADRDRRVLRLDDQHGRPAPHPAAPHRQPRRSRPAWWPASTTTCGSRPAAIVDRVADQGECDFVPEIAAPLPLEIICDMMGIPPSRLAAHLRAHQRHPRRRRPGVRRDMADAHGRGDGAGPDGPGARRGPPGQPAATTSPRRMMHAEVDGEHLHAQELARFFILLVVAGNETTRNAISHGMLPLTRHPDQRAAWQADFDGVRPHRGRGDRALGHAGHPLPPHRDRGHRDRRPGRSPKGDKVVMWYDSANRDERGLRRPVPLRRHAAPRTSTSASAPAGPHFCLGANLARREIR